MTTSSATVADLITQMNRDPTVMNGWDIVLNVLLDPVDDLFALMFREHAPGTWQTVDVSYCELVPNPLGAGEIIAYTAVQATLSQPALSFVADNQNILTVTFSADGTLRQAGTPAPAGFNPATDCRPDDPALDWAARPLAAEPFTATVPLVAIQGSAQSGSTFQAVLNFPAGSFLFPALDQGPNPSTLSTQLRAYLARTNVSYVLSEIQSDAGSPSSLTPTSFRINTLRTNAGKNILQFFIATVGTPQATLTVNANEPVPDGSQFTLMIRRELLKDPAIANLIAKSFMDEIVDVPIDPANEDRVVKYLADKIIAGDPEQLDQALKRTKDSADEINVVVKILAGELEQLDPQNALKSALAKLGEHWTFAGGWLTPEMTYFPGDGLMVGTLTTLNAS